MRFSYGTNWSRSQLCAKCRLLIWARAFLLWTLLHVRKDTNWNTWISGKFQTNIHVQVFVKKKNGGSMWSMLTDNWLQLYFMGFFFKKIYPSSLQKKTTIDAISVWYFGKKCPACLLQKKNPINMSNVKWNRFITRSIFKDLMNLFGQIHKTALTQNHRCDDTTIKI